MKQVLAGAMVFTTAAIRITSGPQVAAGHGQLGYGNPNDIGTTKPRRRQVPQRSAPDAQPTPSESAGTCAGRSMRSL
jgi:hypothetical protein